MSSIVYLYLAYLAAFLIIGGFVVNLERQVAALRRDVDRLKPPEDS